jgi:hypothetical protein
VLHSHVQWTQIEDNVICISLVNHSGVVPDLHRDDSWGDMLTSSCVMLLGVLTAWLFLIFFFSLYDLSAKKAEKHPIEVSKCEAALWLAVAVGAVAL